MTDPVAVITGLFASEGAAVYTLGVQGGPMTGAELAAFEARPHAADACRVRRWDDAAKDPGADYPPLGHFVSLLRGLVTD